MSKATPTVIVVTGHPASGKSSLARRLAKRLEFPYFQKDTIKERLFDVLQSDGADPAAARARSRALSDASIALLLDTIPPLLRAGESLIVEANFKRERDSASLRNACQIQCRVIQIVCHCPPELLQRRFRERIARGGRHASHDDAAYLAEFDDLTNEGPSRALEIHGAVIDFDTSRFSEARVDELATEVRRVMRSS